MDEDAAGVADFKREVDQGFDEALAEVASVLDSVPSVAIPLPGLEPAAYPDPGEDVPFLPAPEGAPNPLQERLDLAGPAPADDEGSNEDAIVEFAPDPAMTWGPRWIKGRRAKPEESDP